MKHLITIISTVLMTTTLCLPWHVKAQSPEKMSYQAVVRDACDKLVTDQVVGMQISILKGSADGTAVYTETHTPTTNANGLVSIEIGNGTVVSGNFSNINWANGSYFIKTETDPTGGTHFTIAGTSQLLSVPYALHAKTAESISYNDPEYNTDSGLSTSNLKKAKKPKPKHFENGGEYSGEDRTLGNKDNFALGLKTNDITRLHITNDGYVGIGNVTPFTKLDVSGVITASGGTSTEWNTAYSWGDHSTQGYLTSFAETDPLFTAWDKKTGISITKSQISDLANLFDGNYNSLTNLPTLNITNWNAAYSWGNHAIAGYLTSFAETDPLFTAWNKDYADLTGTPTLSIANWNTAYNWGDHTGLYRAAIWVPAWTDIIGKPTFATVATSGSYTDLTNKPANATTTVDGFISSTDKIKLDAITGTNTGDQNLSGKVDVVAGKGLSTNDYTTLEQTKLAAITGTNTGDNAVNSLYSGIVSNETHTGDVTGSGALTITNKVTMTATVDLLHLTGR